MQPRKSLTLSLRNNHEHPAPYLHLAKWTQILLCSDAAVIGREF